MLMTKQAIRARVPRLPAAAGDKGLSKNAAGAGGRPLRLLVLGDSTAAGVGAAHQEDALAGQLAVAVTALTGREVSWRVVARSGATVRAVRRELLTRLTEPTEGWQPDLVLVVAGVNDALTFRRPRAFRADVERLVRDVRARLGHDVPMMFAGLPETDTTDALPRAVQLPLSGYLRLLDRQLKIVAGRHPALFHLHSGGPPKMPGDWMAADRFHPSASGYRAWARALSGRVATLVEAL